MTKKPKLDFETAVSLAEEVVSGREDFVYLEPGHYTDCLYEKNGEPSCLVGHMLFNAGVPVEDLHRLDNLTHPQIDKFDTSEARVVVPKLFDVDEKTIEFVAVLQQKQDSGLSWGDALKMAKNVVSVYSEE